MNHIDIQLEKTHKIENFKCKLKNENHRFLYWSICHALIFFDDFIKKHNISFDDITFEMLFNELLKQEAQL